ncbi:MAG: CpsD/CapB family tyrosine-protein kinase [Bacillota bacterium]|nr:CpsD/CapB family tyrosine-protein kinase [Bacillota bacterium]
MLDLIIDKDPKSPISEAYRTIRTNIDFSSIDKEIKTILITSSEPEEGKTTTSSNIALAYAQADKKTLLLDCDLRKPRVHKMFKISGILGLTNIIVDNLKLSEIVYPFNESLDILPSGIIPPNPSEILSSNKMKIFLEEASVVYERIIIDSPPINVVTDTQILSGIVDGVILIVRSGRTNIDNANRAKELLLKAKANILGVVLRGIKTSHRKYGPSEYYYYSEEGEKKKTKRKRKKEKGK